MDSGFNTTSPTNASASTTNTRKRKSEEEFSFNVLPSEILMHIFSMTGLEHKSWIDEEDYSNRVNDISLVCKQWYQLSREPLLWENYPMELREKEFPKKVEKLVDPKFTKINSLYFVGSGRPPSIAPHYAHLVFGGYQSCLECFSVISKLSESEKFNLAQISKSLTSLRFKKYYMKEDVLQRICNLPKLKSLNNWIPSFDPETTFRCITKLTTLEYLKFDFPFTFRNYPNTDYLLYLRELSNLDRLDFDDLPLSENLSHLVKLTKLRVLKFHNLLQATPVFFEGLSTLTQIQKLTLESDDRFFDFAHTLSQPLPKLTRLKLRLRIPSEQFIFFLTPFLPSLEYIHFHGGPYTFLSRNQIEEMVLLAPHVHTVELKCQGITQEDVEELQKKFNDKVKFESSEFYPY
eukprot:TRINITY_DN5067_c0_g1_i1.p1 TRINITY_DN5067_c0_g1~~TRINITY_DN5067_c0_g1_i1.p1  ORF type:complete len:405 (-),score=49.85 TRINITY_DN5067_c0_g1_i1:148-1362(-)